MKLDKFDFVEVENTPFGKVILIGMMEDGPTGVPFKFLENTDTTFLIGDNEVSRTYNLLVGNGIQRDDIILLRINGEPAKLRIDILEDIGINLQALTSNHFDNDIKVTVSSGGISITSNYSEELIVEGKREQFQRTYLFNDFPFTSELTEAITKDALLGYHNIIADYDTVVPTTIMSFFEDEYFFDGGKTESELVLKNGTFDDSCEDCFESKEDLLVYLLKEKAEQVSNKVKEKIQETDGDLFETYIFLYDMAIENFMKKEDEDLYKQIFINIKSSDESIFDLMKNTKPKDVIKYCDLLNTKNLKIENQQDFMVICEMLNAITRKSIIKNFKGVSKEECRSTFLKEIEYLKYGIIKKEDKNA